MEQWMDEEEVPWRRMSKEKEKKKLMEIQEDIQESFRRMKEVPTVDGEDRSLMEKEKEEEEKEVEQWMEKKKS